MHPSEPFFIRAARWLAFGSAVSVLFSIAVCQILLALALAALLFSGTKLRLPRIWLPLALFMAGTVISLAFSGDPAGGLPQIRKFYVFLQVLVVFSTFRDLAIVRRLVLCWTGVGALIAVRSFVQFAAKLEQARASGQNFYDQYVAERITGFMSHWMTFSAQEMFVLLMLAAFLFFAPAARKRRFWLLLGGGLIGLAIVLGFTRSIVWLACPAAVLYLLWFWKRYTVLVAPVLFLAAVLVAPASVQERFRSIYKPRKGVDSNEFRTITRRTGWEMIKAHPWLGLGPEGVKREFIRYVPEDIPRPLPAGWYGHLHNIYIHYAAERGIPVALILMWLVGQILFDFIGHIRRLPPGRSDAKFVLHGAVAVVIATLLEGYYELNLGDSEVLTMFLIVATCGYVALESARAGQENGAVA